MKFSPVYINYMKSDAWMRMRKQVLKRDGYRCRFWFCKATRHLDIHHRTYARLGNERLGDLITYCRFHHNIVTFLTRLLRFLKRLR